MTYKIDFKPITKALIAFLMIGYIAYEASNISSRIITITPKEDTLMVNPPVFSFITYK
jgi:hypothetical protein